MKNFVVIGGGTVSHVRNHLALCAPAYGTTAKKLDDLFKRKLNIHYAEAYRREYGYWPANVDFDVQLYLTKMAGGDQLETNEDVSNLVDKLIADPNTKAIIFNPALIDFDGSVVDFNKPCSRDLDSAFVKNTTSGKYETRLKTSEGEQTLLLIPTAKLLGKIRKERKDIFLVAFKTTCGATEDEQFLTGLHLLKTNSCNLVLANDTKTRMNMVITPEQARYHVTADRAAALDGLASMTVSRAKGTFTRSTVVPGDPVPWNMERIPPSLKAVVDHCITKGAYKPFNGSTVGHFAFSLGGDTFVTSKRKVNFNDLDKVGMVLCQAEDDDKVFAYGAKPSVGGQSQRIIFKEHPETDCIVHFHCPPKTGAKVGVRSQAPFECGSHECGQNTSSGLREVVPGIKCVYLDNHGPNIVFNRNVDPQRVIAFIEENFDLSKSTDQVDRSQRIVA